MKLVNVPFFPGFYDSNLSIDEIYYTEIEENLNPESEYYDPNFDTFNLNVKAYQNWCAELYTDYLHDILVELNLDLKVQFDSIDSPQFYNYGTDRLFVEIDNKTIASLKDFAYNHLELWAKYLEDKFADRAGYIPYYSNDPKDWNKCVESYDHNETGSLLEFYLSQQEGSIEDLEETTIEHLLCNSGIADWIPRSSDRLQPELALEPTQCRW